jgi:hypothetical protein
MDQKSRKERAVSGGVKLHRIGAQPNAPIYAPFDKISMSLINFPTGPSRLINDAGKGVA